MNLRRITLRRFLFAMALFCRDRRPRRSKDIEKAHTSRLRTVEDAGPYKIDESLTHLPPYGVA